MLIFQSRQNLFSKIPWHLLKTRHLARNSTWPKLFLRGVCHPFPFLTVLYGCLQFGTERRMPADLRSRFVLSSSSLISR